jgi:hypothetical protein
VHPGTPSLIDAGIKGGVYLPVLILIILRAARDGNASEQQ